MEGYVFAGGQTSYCHCTIGGQCELISHLPCPTYQLKGDTAGGSIANGDVEEDALSLCGIHG